MGIVNDKSNRSFELKPLTDFKLSNVPLLDRQMFHTKSKYLGKINTCAKLLEEFAPAATLAACIVQYNHNYRVYYVCMVFSFLISRQLKYYSISENNQENKNKS